MNHKVCGETDQSKICKKVVDKQLRLRKIVSLDKHSPDDGCDESLTAKEQLVWIFAGLMRKTFH